MASVDAADNFVCPAQFRIDLQCGTEFQPESEQGPLISTATI